MTISSSRSGSPSLVPLPPSPQASPRHAIRPSRRWAEAIHGSQTSSSAAWKDGRVARGSGRAPRSNLTFVFVGRAGYAAGPSKGPGRAPGLSPPTSSSSIPPVAACRARAFPCLVGGPANRIHARDQRKTWPSFTPPRACRGRGIEFRLGGKRSRRWGLSTVRPWPSGREPCPRARFVWTGGREAPPSGVRDWGLPLEERPDQGGPGPSRVPTATEQTCGRSATQPAVPDPAKKGEGADAAPTRAARAAPRPSGAAKKRRGEHSATAACARSPTGRSACFVDLGRFQGPWRARWGSRWARPSRPGFLGPPTYHPPWARGRAFRSASSGW